MTHTTPGFVRWTITPDLEPGAPGVRHQFRCLAQDDNGTPCGAASSESDVFTTARDWTLRHLRDHPGHTSYAELVTRPWTMHHHSPA